MHTIHQLNQKRVSLDLYKQGEMGWAKRILWLRTKASLMHWFLFWSMKTSLLWLRLSAKCWGSQKIATLSKIHLAHSLLSTPYWCLLSQKMAMLRLAKSVTRLFRLESWLPIAYSRPTALTQAPDKIKESLIRAPMYKTLWKKLIWHLFLRCSAGWFPTNLLKLKKREIMSIRRSLSIVQSTSRWLSSLS